MLDAFLLWAQDNAVVCTLAAIKVADVITKATPTKKDDFVVDVIWGVIRKVFPGAK
jgi:hypothetical protein